MLSDSVPFIPVGVIVAVFQSRLNSGERKIGFVVALNRIVVDFVNCELKLLPLR